MLPNNLNVSNIKIEKYKTRTYKIDLENKRITGYIDDLEALKQTVYIILNVDRYKHLIYSFNYGTEISDLFGKPVLFVLSEIKRRIKEALIRDDRVLDVVDFEFEKDRNKVFVKFRVISIYGDFEESAEEVF